MHVKLCAPHAVHLDRADAPSLGWLCSMSSCCPFAFEQLLLSASDLCHAGQHDCGIESIEAPFTDDAREWVWRNKAKRHMDIE